MNNKVLKGILIALLAVYVISPVDFAPGPVDDMLLILFSALMNQIGSSRSGEDPEEVEGTWQDISGQ